MLDPETSKGEWKWDEGHFEPKSKEERSREYGQHLNRETVEAKEQW